MRPSPGSQPASTNLSSVCRVRERRRRRPLPSEPYVKVALHTAQADPYPPCFPRPCRAGVVVSPRGPFAGPWRGRIQLAPSAFPTHPAVVGESARPTSAAFRRGPRGPIHRVMPSPCLWAGGVRFLGHPVPAAAWAVLPKIVRPTGTPARPQRGCRVPHLKRCDGGGRLLYCGAWVSVSRLRTEAGPVARHRRDCHRGSGDLSVTQPQRRFTRVRPSRLSLARVYPDGFGLPLGFTRLLSHASLPGACAGREPTWTLIRAVGTHPTTTLQKRLTRRTALQEKLATFRAEISAGFRPLAALAYGWRGASGPATPRGLATAPSPAILWLTQALASSRPICTDVTLNP